MCVCARAYPVSHIWQLSVCRGGYLTAKSRVIVSWASPVTHRYISWLGRGETALSFPPWSFLRDSLRVGSPAKERQFLVVVVVIVMIATTKWQPSETRSDIDPHRIQLPETNWKQTEQTKEKEKKNTRVFPMAHLIYSRQCSKSMANPLAVMNFNSWPASK
jgi:hypothetical protein